MKKIKELMNSNNRILIGAMLLIVGCFLLIYFLTGDTYAVITGYSCETGTVGTFAPTYLSGTKMLEQVHYDNHCLTVIDTKSCYVIGNGGAVAFTETCSQYNYDYSCTYTESKLYNQRWKKCTRGTDVSYCDVQSDSGCGSYENSGYTCEWVLADMYTCKQYIDYGAAKPIESEITNVCYQCNTNPNMLYWSNSKDSIPSEMDGNCGSDWHEYNSSEQYCKSYTINFNLMGGTGSFSTQYQAKGGGVLITTNIPKKDGNVFQGWSIVSGSSTVSYEPGQTYSGNHDITLYAVWKPNSGGGTVTPTTYTINYDANGGSGAPGSQTATAGVETKLSTTKPIRVNYEFNGWNTKSDGTGTNYSSGANYNGSSDVTLYAVWKPNSGDSGTTPGDTPEEEKNYNIKYVLNGGVGTGNPTTAKYDEVVTINNPTKTVTVTCNVNKTGATIGNQVMLILPFDGWTSSDLDTKTAYYGSTAWTNGNTKVTATSFKNLTAVGKTVTLEANWKDGEATLPGISKEGYSCVWNTKSDGSGDSYYSGSKYTVDGDVSSVNLYAICKINSNVGDENPKVDDEIDKGPTTGDVLIYAVWGIGVGALGYCIYYFRKKKFDV